MKLLSHRGVWHLPKEKNSLQALCASFDMGIGIETDIRDCDGSLVISHDPPRRANILSFEAVLESYIERPTRPVLALNIKSDGLQAPLLAALQTYGVENYFVFDMSVPDTLGYQRLQMPFAARISEYEPDNLFVESAEWIWLDAFHGEWFDVMTVQSWLDKGKYVAIVSPELHGRPHLSLWNTLKSLRGHPQLYICTDLVNECKDFFHVEKY